MRRALAVLLAGSLALAVTGCALSRGSSRASPSSSGTTPGPAPAAAADSARKAAPNDTAAVAGDDSASLSLTNLSPASQLMMKACDNYVSVNPASEKAPEVLAIKASIFYNNRLFAPSRETYQKILQAYPKSREVVDATRMIAQSYYEEKQFQLAEQWYGKLRDMAASGTDKEEAIARIAESIYRTAQSNEEQQRYKEAAAQYERVALEFPESKIADVSLYNAGLAYEKLTEWSHAVLCFQKMYQRYETSKLLSKARFRAAKCFEKLLQWENAAETYLRVVASDPTSELAPTAMYNAGFSFENANKLVEAATTFEKMASLFPNSPDAADVLFKAGDLFGRVKDWASVSRVNQEFSRRFGNDQNRVVQALCMVGIALYMQDKRAEAVMQLQKAVETFGRLKSPSAANRTYAANAQYTIGEIYHDAMRQIVLTQPETVYRKLLKQKSDELDRTIKAYSKALSFGVLEWSTRSICQMGQANEDFAVAVLRQQRPADLPIDRRMALELGIAKALEEYLVNNALRFHEQNVKLGIKEKTEDKYVLISKQKLTSLPFLAGTTYLDLVGIYEKTQGAQQAEGLALIGRKLEFLQRVAPYQQEAMALFMKCLEMGATYGQTDDAYKQSSHLIIQTSTSVGRTYAEVATIAREAPIPAAFDKYERFVYKTKLLKQVESYEDQALEYFLKALKIAQAYTVDDDAVRAARDLLAQLLFARGRCLDLLCIGVYADPPYPDGVDEAEKEELRAQLEEVALRLQEQAFEIYKSILAYAQKGNAAGPGVRNAYVRLYQNAPDQYGARVEKIESRSISSGPQWKCSPDSADGWTGVDFADTAWRPAQRVPGGQGSSIRGFPDKTPEPMWFGSGDPANRASYVPAPQLHFRRSFALTDQLKSATLHLAAIGNVSAFVNGGALPVDTVAGPGWQKARSWDVTSLIRKGRNVVALRVASGSSADRGVFPLLVADVVTAGFAPQPPGSDTPMDPREVAEGAYDFGYFKNFSPEPVKK